MTLSPRDTHIPEFAEAAVSAQMAQAGPDLPAMEQDSLSPARPVRLFAQPEEVSATAEVPDGPAGALPLALYHA
jgi:protein ImuB